MLLCSTRKRLRIVCSEFYLIKECSKLFSNQTPVYFINESFQSICLVDMEILRLALCLEPYYKSELELKSNSSEILPDNCKFIYDSTSIHLKLTKLKLEILTSDFQRKKERYELR